MVENINGPPKICGTNSGGLRWWLLSNRHQEDLKLITVFLPV